VRALVQHIEQIIVVFDLSGSVDLQSRDIICLRCYVLPLTNSAKQYVASSAILLTVLLGAKGVPF
jgi:hypothetical protein